MAVQDIDGGFKEVVTERCQCGSKQLARGSHGGDEAFHCGNVLNHITAVVILTRSARPQYQSQKTQ